MGGAYPRAPQRRSDYEDGAAGLAPRTRLFVTRSPVGGNKIARIATRGLFNLIRVVGIAAPAHRADETMLGQHLSIRLGSVLTAAACVVGQSWRRPTPLDRR